MKKHFYVAGLFLFLVAVSLQGCYYDNADKLYPDPPVVVADTIVGFAADIQPMIATSCATSSGCHAVGANNPELVSYDDIKLQVSRIEARAITDKSMPPSGSP